MNRQHISTAELVGRLGQEPDLRYTDQQVPYTQLSVATSERYTTGGGEIREKTEWHRAVAWGEVAESIARDFKKGDAIALSGAMRINSFEKDGIKHRTTELNVERADRSPDAKLSKNEARIVGVVREDAKARTLDSGTAMTLLSVATTTVVNGKDREDWHSITLWGKTAEAARDIKAGDTIAINGSLRHRTVGDDGQERKLSAIDCRQFEVLERSQQKGKEISRERTGSRRGAGRRRQAARAPALPLEGRRTRHVTQSAGRGHCEARVRPLNENDTNPWPEVPDGYAPHRRRATCWALSLERQVGPESPEPNAGGHAVRRVQDPDHGAPGTLPRRDRSWGGRLRSASHPHRHHVRLR